MSAINELREDLAHTETAQFVTTMLRDISATKLQSIRTAYEANEKYYSELHQLMHLLQTYAVEKKIDIPVARKKRVVVAVTSNRRFYGTLNIDVIKKMKEVVTEDVSCECLVLGQTGKQIIERQPISIKTAYISFSKDEPTSEEIHSVVTQLTEYTEVIVVHPTYMNAFQQVAKVTDVTHVPDANTRVESSTLEYIFEPDIPAMLNFFSTQIRYVLFDRIVLETRLALTGARLMKMQRAREKTEEIVKQQRHGIHKEISTMQSMRLLETFSGFNTKNTI